MVTIPDHDNENDLIEESEDPARSVFVDPSGRRRSIIRRVAIGVCVAVACYGILLAAALFGAPTLPAALVPRPAPEPQVTVENPATTADKAPVKPSGPESSGTDRETSATSERPAQTSAAGPPGTTPQQPSVTSVPSSTDRRNSRAPDVPPGQTKTTPPGNGR